MSFPTRKDPLEESVDRFNCAINTFCAMLCLAGQLCLTLCNPVDCSPPGSSVHGDSPGKNTGVGCHALLQGIFPSQGLNPSPLHLLHWQVASLLLSHLGNPSLLPVCCAALSRSVTLNFFDPLDCSLPGSSVLGILQARILEWVAISSSRGSSGSRD